MDLNAPLGMEPPRRRYRLMPWIGFAAVLAVAGAAGTLLYEADPHGGEPYAVAVIPPASPSTSFSPRSEIDPAPTGSVPAASTAVDGDTARIENGVKVVSPSARVASRDAGPLVIDVSKALDENARKTVPSGRGPHEVTSGKAAQTAPRPRVAIFVGGLGLNVAATRAVIATMPGAVSLAFVPFGEATSALVDAARTARHEVLLQLPMQGPKGAGAGPHTLRPGEPAADTQDDLAWSMSRFGGYAGVTNLLGDAVTADPLIMTAVLQAIGKRGLFYLDDGTSRHSVVRGLAAGLDVPATQADVVLDATADPAAVRANLDRLVAIARAKGSAIGVANGLSDHLAVIAAFAAGLDAQGLTLVPVSTIVGAAANLATAR